MTETQQHLAQQLNRLMHRLGGGTDERVLAAMADPMPLFTPLLDTSTETERNALVQTSPAFGRSARVRERLAARLAAPQQRRCGWGRRCRWPPRRSWRRMSPAAVAPRVDGEAPWRRQPASEKQTALLQKLGLSVPTGGTKGEAADLLSAVLGDWG